MNKASILVILLCLLASCNVYTFSGYTIEPDVKTVHVIQFRNEALIVSPGLDQNFSERLREKLINEVNLDLVSANDADLIFSGTISKYSIDPVSFSPDDQAAQNRLTVTVNIDYTNVKYPEKSWKSGFSRFSDFDVDQNFSDVEQDLVDEIGGQLIDDIFNKAFVNW